MITRRFGKTGHNAKIITLGGCGPGFVDQEKADEAMQLAINYGLNTLDIAPTYGKAEIRIGPWVKKYRNQFFIAEKTMQRTKEGVMREFKQSLENLNCKKFELYQFHAVKDLNELDQIIDKGGAYEAFQEALETGLIDRIGLTCHDDMQVALKAIELIDELEVLLIPVNVAAKAHPSSISDYEPVLEKALEKDIGITAIKAIAQGRWKSEKEKQELEGRTWYKPIKDPDLIEKAVHFTLSQEGVTAYALPCDVRYWKPVLEAGENYKQMSIEEQQKLIEIAKQGNFHPLFPE